jgi:hypothetical protein
LYRAENHLKDCKDVIIEAVEDAYKTIKKTWVIKPTPEWLYL